MLIKLLINIKELKKSYYYYGTISFEETNLKDTIPIETLEKMFKDAENLLNFKDGVTAANSNGGRI